MDKSPCLRSHCTFERCAHCLLIVFIPADLFTESFPGPGLKNIVGAKRFPVMIGPVKDLLLRMLLQYCGCIKPDIRRKNIYEVSEVYLLIIG
jgi:hypothetical protein